MLTSPARAAAKSGAGPRYAGSTGSTPPAPTETPAAVDVAAMSTGQLQDLAAQLVAALGRRS